MFRYVADDLKVKSFAILNDSGAQAKSGIEVLKKLAAERGITVTAAQQFDTRAADMTPQMLALKRDNPEAFLFWPVAQEDVVTAIKNMRDIGWELPVSAANQGAASAAYVKNALGVGAMKNMHGTLLKLHGCRRVQPYPELRSGQFPGPWRLDRGPRVRREPRPGDVDGAPAIRCADHRPVHASAGRNHAVAAAVIQRARFMGYHDDGCLGHHRRDSHAFAGTIFVFYRKSFPVVDDFRHIDTCSVCDLARSGSGMVRLPEMVSVSDPAWPCDQRDLAGSGCRARGRSERAPTATARIFHQRSRHRIRRLRRRTHDRSERRGRIQICDRRLRCIDHRRTWKPRRRCCWRDIARHTWNDGDVFFGGEFRTLAVLLVLVAMLTTYPQGLFGFSKARTV